jgi:hypothetical protein
MRLYDGVCLPVISLVSGGRKVRTPVLYFDQQSVNSLQFHVLLRLVCAPSACISQSDSLKYMMLFASWILQVCHFKNIASDATALSDSIFHSVPQKSNQQSAAKLAKVYG